MAPAVWPRPQPRFTIPNARPWSTPLDSAPSDSMAIAGDHSMPIHGAATTTTTPRRKCRAGERDDHRRDNTCCQADRAGRESSSPVGDPARDGCHDGLDPGRHEEDGGDGAGSGAEIVQLERDQHLDRAEEQARDEDQGHAVPHCGRAGGSSESADTRVFPGRRLHAERERDQAQADEGDAGEHRPASHSVRRCSQGGSGQDPGDRGGHRRPDHLASSLARRRPHHPCERPGPRERAADTLEKSARVEQGDVPAKCEADAGDAHQGQSDQHGPSWPYPSRQHASGERSDQRPCRVRAGKDARRALGEAELLGEAGKQRHDRREEHRVDEDDSGRQHQESSHCANSRAASEPSGPAG